jgi:hypothetical protein
MWVFTSQRLAENIGKYEYTGEGRVNYGRKYVRGKSLESFLWLQYVYPLGVVYHLGFIPKA